MADEQIKLQKFKLEALVDIEFDVSDVVEQLTSTEALDLIQELDEEANCWELSLLAYHHFKEQYEIACRLQPEYAAMTVDQLEDALVKFDAAKEAA